MKKLVIFGDSISTYFHGDGGYIKHLNEANIFDKVQSFAVSASGLSKTTPNALSLSFKSHRKAIIEATHLLIWHGTNDWFYHIPVNQFKRELRELCIVVNQINPLVSITLITPLIRYQATFGNIHLINGYVETNQNGETLIDFEKAVRQIAHELNTGLICMRLETPFTIHTMDEYFEDGVHPNEAGYNQIFIPIAKEFINQ